MEKYIIIKPNNGAGMFSFIWQTLNIIKNNQGKKFYIDFSDSIYRSNNTDNAWDYFFEQPDVANHPSKDQIENTLNYTYLENLPPDQQYETEYLYEELKTPEDIMSRRKTYSEIIKRYVKLKPDIKRSIDQFCDTNFSGKRVVAVHLRGTDHPYKQDVNLCISVIQRYLSENDVIFVSSDEYSRFNMIRNYFGKRVVFNNSHRSLSPAPLHNVNYPIGNYVYKTGLDVITEAYIMSRSNLLICCPCSNVNSFSRYMNPNLKSVTIWSASVPYVSRSTKKVFDYVYEI